MAEEGETIGGRFEQATNSAFEKLQALPDEETPEPESPVEPEPSSAPEPTPGPGDGGEPVVEPTAEEKAAIEAYYKDQWDGRDIALSREQVRELVNFGLNAYRDAQLAKGQPVEPAQGASTQEPKADAVEFKTAEDLTKYIEKKIQEAVNPWKEKVELSERNAMRQEMMTAVNSALDKVEGFKDLNGHPRYGRVLKSFLLTLQGANPDSSWESTSGILKETFDAYAKAQKQEYIQQKISQSQHKVEGQGGGTPSKPPTKPQARDLFDGTVEKRAMERLARSMAAEA